MCVGILYNTSKNGSFPSFSISICELDANLSELMWERKLSRESCLWGQMKNVLSTYWSHSDGCYLVHLMATISKRSMYRSASTGHSGESIGASSISSYSSSSNVSMWIS